MCTSHEWIGDSPRGVSSTHTSAARKTNVRTERSKKKNNILIERFLFGNVKYWSWKTVRANRLRPEWYWTIQRMARRKEVIILFIHTHRAEFSGSNEQLCNRFPTQFHRFSSKLGSFLNTSDDSSSFMSCKFTLPQPTAMVTEQAATMTNPLPETYSLLSRIEISFQTFSFFLAIQPTCFLCRKITMKIMIQSISKWWISFEDYRVKRSKEERKTRKKKI